MSSPTCHLAAVRNPDSTEAVVGHRGDLACTARAMVVVAVRVRVWHWIRVVRVQIVAAFRRLEQKQGLMKEHAVISTEEDWERKRRRAYIVGLNVLQRVLQAVVHDDHRDALTGDVTLPHARHVDVHATLYIVVL